MATSRGDQSIDPPRSHGGILYVGHSVAEAYRDERPRPRHRSDNEAGQAVAQTNGLSQNGLSQNGYGGDVCGGV